MTTRNFKKIYWLQVLQNWAWKMIFLVRTWFLRSMGAVAQNRLIPQKFHKNRNCTVSKSKIIIGLCFLALKARKAANWPRTFFTGLTVISLFSKLCWKYAIIVKINVTWKCKLATASTFGKIQVDIIKASMWTAISNTVQTANVISSSRGTLSSIWISTMATMAKPDNRAEVRLDAFNLARLRFNTFQW